MSELDTNTKMIISKYLYGKDFTDFVNAFNLQDYYHTTFNYITINNTFTTNCNKITCISNLTFEKIIKTLQSFPNLNEIILNFVSPSQVIYDYLLKIIEKYYNKFKKYTNFTKIKIRIVDENGISYKEIHIEVNTMFNKIENILPNFEQPFYIYFDDILTYKISDIVKFVGYNIVIRCDFYNITELNNYLKVFNYQNIYLKVVDSEKKLIESYEDIKKYFKIDEDNDIRDIKPIYNIYNIKTKYNNTFKEWYYKLFKFKNTDTSYLNDYVYNLEECNDEETLMMINDMYKYNVKNMYFEGSEGLDYIDITEKLFELNEEIRYTNGTIGLNHDYDRGDYEKLHEEIKKFVKY